MYRIVIGMKCCVMGAVEKVANTGISLELFGFRYVGFVLKRINSSSGVAV